MNVRNLNTSEVKEEIKKEGLTLLDIFATWCGPCKMLLPIIDEVGGELTDVNVIKMDADNNATSMSDFKATSLPTVILYKDGLEVDRFLGFKPKQFIIDFVAKHR